MSGEINRFAEVRLVETYSRAEESSAEIILLNFTDVSFINRTGIALIVGLFARARKSHQQLRVFGLREHYIEIFQITRLADFMQIHPDENNALESIAQTSGV